MRSAAVLGLLVVAGCSVGPDYIPPAATLPSAFRARLVALQAVPSPDIERWWERLGDTQLTALVDRALAGSTDLAVAQALLRQARAAAGAARSELTPRLDARGRHTLADAA